MANRAKKDELSEKTEIFLGNVLPERYRVEKQLGGKRGGYGIVVLAYDKEQNRRVAIKILDIRNFESKSAKDYALTSFEREIAILKKRKRDYVIDIFDSQCELESNPPRAYYVMPFLENAMNLGEFIAQHESLLKIDQIRQLFEQIATGVGALHSDKILHRDLKTGNILINTSDKPTAYIIDLGLGYELTERNQGNDGIKSQSFASPEAFDTTATLTEQADIYSLGVILYLMLTKQLPYQTFQVPVSQAENMHRSAPIPNIREVRIDLVPEWQEIINCALAKTPEKRYSNTDIFIQAVNRVCELQKHQPEIEERTETSTDTAVAKSERANGRAGWIISSSVIGFGLLLCLAVSAGVVALQAVFRLFAQAAEGTSGLISNTSQILANAPNWLWGGIIIVVVGVLGLAFASKYQKPIIPRLLKPKFKEYCTLCGADVTLTVGQCVQCGNTHRRKAQF